MGLFSACYRNKHFNEVFACFIRLCLPDKAVGTFITFINCTDAAFILVKGRSKTLNNLLAACVLKGLWGKKVLHLQQLMKEVSSNKALTLSHTAFLGLGNNTQRSASLEDLCGWERTYGRKLVPDIKYIKIKGTSVFNQTWGELASSLHSTMKLTLGLSLFVSLDYLRGFL